VFLAADEIEAADLAENSTFSSAASSDGQVCFGDTQKVSLEECKVRSQVLLKLLCP